MAVTKVEGPTVVELRVNGQPYSGVAEPRLLLSDFLGTHWG